MRYQFYREHKYVSAALNEVERLIAKTDFCDLQRTIAAEQAWNELKEMLQGHACYENERLHPLLERKCSKAHMHAAEEHAHQNEQLQQISTLFQRLRSPHSEEERVALGYELYLLYRKFVADNLAHLHEEETQILPELQRLYSDEELMQVEAETYQIMTLEDLIQMVETLFPHMNPQDHQAFLSEIQAARPDLFPEFLLRLRGGGSPQEDNPPLAERQG